MHASEAKGDVEQHRFSITSGARALHMASAGKGAIEAFVSTLSRQLGIAIEIDSYAEHALGAGADAKAVAYVALALDRGQRTWGVGSHASIVTASLAAIISALNRSDIGASASKLAAAE